MNKLISIAIISSVFILLIVVLINSNIVNQIASTQNSLSENQGSNENIVPLDQIVSGGPPQDGIPSIDNPKFISTDEAESFISESDLVAGVNIDGDIRGYPLQILVWHEIVNDIVGGVPIAVTYCPLCFTNQVFNRTVDGEVLEFGTSGKLYNSNLVMYDRNTNSLWSQAMAQSIAGEVAGVKLERIPFDLMYWKEWKAIYPDSKILSQDTGHVRPYGADPYGDYYTNPDILFPISHEDDRIGLKEIVIGLEDSGRYKAYKLQDIEDLKVIDDKVEGKSITLWSAFPFMVRMFDPTVNGQILTFYHDGNKNKNTFVDNQTRSEWNFDGKSIAGKLEGNTLSRLPFDEGFWFEWVAFHPETEIYER